jgi:hypothetical protein
MKIGAAGMNGQKPQSRDMLRTAAAEPKEHPDEDRSAERRLTQVAFSARPPAPLALSHLCRLADR